MDRRPRACRASNTSSSVLWKTRNSKAASANIRFVVARLHHHAAVVMMAMLFLTRGAAREIVHEHHLHV
jgi:uncharacterized protein (DUF305 family)